VVAKLVQALRYKPEGQEFDWIFHWRNPSGRTTALGSTQTLTEISLFCFLWRCGPTRAMASSFLRFLDHTQRRITVGRTPLYEWSARRRDLYLKTHNTHNRQTSMPPVGFKPTISAGERPQTYALDRAATGIGNWNKCHEYFLGGKCGRCVWLTTLPPSCIYCLEIWESEHPATLMAYNWPVRGFYAFYEGMSEYKFTMLTFCVLYFKLPYEQIRLKSDVWLTVHRNSVWIRKTN